MKLLLVSTYGSSLESWRRDGILERELALYAAHAEAGVETVFLGHGGAEDRAIAAERPWLTVLANPGLHPRLYGIAAPRLHASAIRPADLVKTNQMFGAHIALRAARHARRPLIVRQGYGHYEHRVEEHGAESRAARRALAYERRHLRAGDASIFTTPELAERATTRHGLEPARVHVLPNYVEPSVWTPQHQPPAGDTAFRLVFFGRFTEQKNLAALIEAAAATETALTLVGAGPLEEALRAQASSSGADVQWIGRLDQSDLRAVLATANAFVLPSHYEGHPKSLIEAMSHGMPVLAADSPGINAQVRDGATAVLMATSAQAIAEGIKRMRALGREGRAALGAAARKEALTRFSVEAIAARERALFAALLLEAQN